MGIKLLRKPKNFFELDFSSWTLPVTSAMSMAWWHANACSFLIAYWCCLYSCIVGSSTDIMPLDCLDASMGIDVVEESCLLIVDATRLSRTGIDPAVPSSGHGADGVSDKEPDIARNGDGCRDWLANPVDTDGLPGAPNTPPAASSSCSRCQDMHRFFESFRAIGLGILDTDSVFTPTSLTFDALYGTFVRVMGINRAPTFDLTPRRPAMESLPRNCDARVELDCSQILDVRGTEAIWCSSRLRKIVRYTTGEVSCPGQRLLASSTTRCSDRRVHSTHFRQEPRNWGGSACPRVFSKEVRWVPTAPTELPKAPEPPWELSPESDGRLDEEACRSTDVNEPL